MVLKLGSLVFFALAFVRMEDEEELYQKKSAVIEAVPYGDYPSPPVGGSNLVTAVLRHLRLGKHTW